ncbi:hypothetical protein AAG906_008316 [Vitis piasezkii]
MEKSWSFRGVVWLLCGFFMLSLLVCSTNADAEYDKKYHPTKNVNLTPFMQYLSVYQCMLNVSEHCDKKYYLTEKGWPNVTNSDVDTFCKGGCAEHTKAVLECISLVKQDYEFADENTVPKIDYTITKGCNDGGTYHDSSSIHWISKFAMRASGRAGFGIIFSVVSAVLMAYSHLPNLSLHPIQPWKPPSSPSPPPSPSPKTLTLTQSKTLTLTYPKSLNPYRRTSYSTTIRSAISRTKKEETVQTVKEQLENCHLLAAIKYNGFTVQQFQELRRSLPEKSKLIVAKNTLVYKAIEGTSWAALEPCMKGMNVFLFVHSEEIPAAIKPYRDFQKEKKLEGNDFTGAVFEGKFYGPDDFKALESMPTRAEIYAKLLGALQSPASALVGTLQAPARDLVMVLKAYVKKLEEEG